MDSLLEVKPHQVTLVPDPPDVITSNSGRDSVAHACFLKTIISRLKDAGIRTSVFVDTELQNIKGAANIGTDRIALYTESYALAFAEDKTLAIEPFMVATQCAKDLGLGVNAGHDLNLENLRYFSKKNCRLY